MAVDSERGSPVRAKETALFGAGSACQGRRSLRGVWRRSLLAEFGAANDAR